MSPLQNCIDALDSAPLLFVGAGISRRYFGLPDWKGLLSQLAKSTGRPVEYYLSAADGDYPRAGSLLAEAFHETWWSSPEFEESRSLYKETAARGRELPFKIEVGRFVARGQLTTEKTLLEELEAFKNICVDVVVTTNYDRLLEIAFPSFTTYTGQRSLLFAPLHGVAETYKIHGSADDPTSLVITTADYERFHKENPYLIAKLATMFAERPVIFVGYSISDSYIRDILSTLVGCLDADQVAQLSKRVFFVEYKPGAKLSVSDGHFSLSDDRHTLPLIRIEASDYTDVYRALGTFQRRLPARVLRLLKERVYELVSSTAPSGSLAAVDIDATTMVDKIDVVFGVGVRSLQGYTPLTRDDLALDTLADVSKFDAKKILTATLPGMPSHAWVPVWRYLQCVAPGGDISTLAYLSDSTKRLASHTLADYRKGIPYEGPGNIARATKHKSIDGLFASESLSKALYLMFLRDPATIDADKLLAELKKSQNDVLLTPGDSRKSLWMRAVCLYDRLKYGPPLK